MKTRWNSSIQTNTVDTTESIPLKTLLSYDKRGWSMVPLKPGTKEPMVKDWQVERLSVFMARTYLQEKGANLGIVLGDMSGGLVDIDLDCPEALAIADLFLPPTEMMFGRASTPESHWIFSVEEAGGIERFKGPDTGDTLIEYRANGGQTMFPPSIHPNGEAIEFVKDGEPAEVSRDDLIKAVKSIAAVSVLARHWNEGSRHDLAMASGGALAWSKIPRVEAERIIEAVCIAADDGEVKDRLKAVQTSYDQHSANNKVTGWPTLVNMIGRKVADKIQQWLV